MCLIRNLLDDRQDLYSDTEDEDEFVPSRNELQSSEEEEDEAATLESDEEVVFKKGRSSASQTPQSKRRSHFSTRTPRKTANKVKYPFLWKRKSATCEKCILFASLILGSEQQNNAFQNRKEHFYEKKISKEIFNVELNKGWTKFEGKTFETPEILTSQKNCV